MAVDPNWRRGLRPEMDLIFCCAHTRLNDAANARVREILRGPLSWPEVSALALEHHIDPLLHENLNLVGDDLVPTDWLADLQDARRKSAATAVLYFAELLRITEICEAEGLPLIPYKGPVLSWLAMGDLARRRFLDLDFFVPQKDIPRAAALLQAAGYQSQFEHLEDRPDHAGIVPGQYGFYREATQALIELHTERTLRYFPVPLDFKKMSGRVITVEISGRNVRTFSIEDTLVMLCVHGAKHFWNRLGWIVDVAELVAAQPVDWPLTMRIAEKLKSTRVLLLGIFLAWDLLNSPVPETIIEQARRDANVRRLAARVERELARESSAHAGVFPRAIFRIRSRDRVVDAFKHLLRLALLPTEEDRQSVRLPRVFAPFYSLVRPWKLMREYGVGLRQNPRAAAQRIPGPASGNRRSSGLSELPNKRPPN